MGIRVKKLDGRLEPYDEIKLIKSLKNAGADDSTIDKIMGEVQGILYDGIETKKLFRFVLSEFSKCDVYSSCRYNLKQAILNLGVPGFYFEQFVGRLMKKRGYQIQMNQIYKVQKETYEIDIVAKKGKEVLMVECKHHSKPWLGCKIKTAMSVNERFHLLRPFFNSALLITNTKFFGPVMDYANREGLNLMGWKYPKNDSLEMNIEKFKLYPVTVFTSLKPDQMETLLNMGCVLAEDVLKLKQDDMKKLKLTEPQRISFNNELESFRKVL